MAFFPFKKHGLLKRVTAIFIIVTLLVPSTLALTTPKETEAIVGCFAGATAAAEGTTGAAGATAVPTFDLPAHVKDVTRNFHAAGGTARECVIDGLAWMFAKMAVQQISQSIVTWINSGFEGSPAFVTDPGQFFLDIGDQVAGQFIEAIGLGYLCDPFSIDVQLALALDRSQQIHDRGCSVTDVIQNFDEFVKGDFSEGGWSGWFEMTQKQSNNPYGSYVEASAALSVRINGQEVINGNLLEWGKGFMSWQDCEAYNDDDECTKRGPVKTPGSVIEGQLENVMGSGIRQLELADEFNEIVGALMGQLVSQVFTAAGGLFGASDNDSRHGSSYLDRLVSENIGDQQSREVPGADGEGSIPEDQNLSLRKDTLQSSQYRDYSSELAVDGLTSGDIRRTRVGNAITLVESQAFWQVDLGDTRPIEQIEIHRNTVFPAGDWYGRSVEQAIGDFRIFYSNTEFPSDFDPIDPGPSFKLVPVEEQGVTGECIANTSEQFFNMPETGPCTVQVSDLGQYVRIQRVEPEDEENRLMLAEVTVQRNLSPTIDLNGESPLVINRGETFTEPGYTATDNEDGDLTDEVVTGGSVDTSTPDTYTLTYNVTDSGGATAKQVTRTVVVIERPTN